MAKKKKAKKKQEIVQARSQPIILGRIEVPLNECQLVDILRGRMTVLNVAEFQASLEVKYERHPDATIQGLAQFWCDVESIARSKRVILETSPGSAKAFSRSTGDYAREERQNMLEEQAGAAVRTTQAAAAAMQSLSFIPPFAKKISEELNQQHQLVEETKKSAASPEEADAKIKKLQVAAPQAQLTGGGHE